MNLRQSLNVIIVLALLLGALSVTAAAAPNVDNGEGSDRPGETVTTGAPPPTRLRQSLWQPALPSGAPVPAPSGSPAGGLILWDQPLSAVNQGAFADQDYETDLDPYDIYLADDLHNDYSWSVETVYVPGNTWDDGGDLTCANSLHWEIYADGGGVPDGDPSGGGNPPFWSLSLPVTDTQVSLSTGVGGFLTDVTLDLASPLYLPPGFWWFVFYPQMDYSTCFKYGRHVADTTGGEVAQVINPGEGWGFPAGWTSIQDEGTFDVEQQDLAFRFEGGPGCTWIELLREDFETWPPAGWSIIDNEGGGCVWERNVNADFSRPNYAGGDGYCADADTDLSLCYPMDTELWSPPLDLTGAAAARLTYLTAYYDITAGGGDYAQVLFSDNGGASWSELLFWDESHDPTGPGEFVDLSLPVGGAESHVSFHYYGPTYDWYYEVDQVVVSACYADYQPSVILSPERVTLEGCAGVEQQLQFEVTNLTGVEGTFDLSYSVPGGHGYLTGPTEISVPHGGMALLAVAFTPELCLPDGAVVTGIIEIADPGGQYTDTAVIEETIAPGGWKQIANDIADGRMDNVTAGWDDRVWSITGWGGNANVHTFGLDSGTWQSVPNSAPPFGLNNARSGCQVGDVVYMYGDGGTENFEGLWMYDMAANSWSQVVAGGDAPVQTGIWAPAWAYDPEDQLCYLTGGATSPGEGNMASVYVYDPSQNLWLDQLPDFESQRNFHAAFVLDQGGKQLCVVGGVNRSEELNSTQCYDLATGTWGPENDDLGPLPSDWWGMGYSDKWHLGTNHQLWLTAGVSDTVITDETLYYDVLSGAWLSGGALPSGAAYRGSATTMNNEIYHIGGASSGFEFVGWSDRHVQCLMCAEAGILQGTVLDGENGDAPTCTQAAVHVEPLNYDVSVGPDGFYQTHLISGTYGVSATAPGYSVEGPVPAQVTQGMTTTLDFALSRPVVEIAPEGFLSITVAISREWTVPLTVRNTGSLPLEFAISEAGGDIPWVWTSPMTGTVAAGSSTAVDVTFFCTEQGEHAGTLVLENGDPCRASLDIPLLVLCQDVVPTYFPVLFRN